MIKSVKLTDDQKYNIKLLILLVVGFASGIAWFYIDESTNYDFGSPGKHSFGATTLLMATKMLLAGIALSFPLLSVILYFKRDLF